MEVLALISFKRGIQKLSVLNLLDILIPLIHMYVSSSIPIRALLDFKTELLESSINFPVNFIQKVFLSLKNKV